MNLRSPAEFYIKYLLVHPAKYTNVVVRQALEELGIFFLGDAYLDQLRKRLIIPDPFRPTDKTHPRSHRFIIAEGIRSLFLPTRDTRIALKLVELARVKEFVEASLLSHAPPGAIAARVTSNGTICTAGAVLEFKKYFWNIDLLTATQMRTLLDMELVPEIDHDKDQNDVRSRKKSMKKASYLDARKLAADLPFSPITALLSQMRMGVMPNRLELARVLQSAQGLAAAKTMEALIIGSPQDAGRALSYSIVMKNMMEVLENVVKPDEHLREQLQAIALRTDSATVPSIHQLSEGKHTADLQPTTTQVTYEPAEEGTDEHDGSEVPPG